MWHVYNVLTCTTAHKNATGRFVCKNAPEPKPHYIYKVRLFFKKSVDLFPSDAFLLTNLPVAWLLAAIHIICDM